MMSKKTTLSKITPSPEIESLCWTCKFNDDCVSYSLKGDTYWSQTCEHPDEYIASDIVENCPGYITR